MSLVEELPEDQPEFSSEAAEADEAVVAHAEAGTSGEHGEELPPRDAEEDERLLVQAREAKERGNTHFKAGELPEALECYSEAIELAAPTEVEEVGVFFANRAAVFSRMGQHQAVCDDCDAALQRQPGYVKALLRRAQAKEALDQPSEALADMKKALEIEPGAKAAAAAVPRLEAAAAAKLEQQKDEMLGKLKELGNGILGKFGMSLAVLTRTIQSLCLCTVRTRGAGQLGPGRHCCTYAVSVPARACRTYRVPCGAPQVAGQLQGRQGPEHRQLQHLLPAVAAARGRARVPRGARACRFGR